MIGMIHSWHCSSHIWTGAASDPPVVVSTIPDQRVTMVRVPQIYALHTCFFKVLVVQNYRLLSSFIGQSSLGSIG